MKLNFLFVLFFLTPGLCFSQQSYISTDSTVTYGIKIKDGGSILNSNFCNVEINGKEIQYTPYDIKEYGFKDGRVYVSKKIDSSTFHKKVFLERLDDGELSLYFYRDKKIKSYFIAKDTSLFIRLDYKKDNYSFKDTLNKLTNNCPFSSEVIKYVSYNKKSLSKFISRYNQCISTYYPHNKFGLFLGIESTKIKIPNNFEQAFIKDFAFSFSEGISIGYFIDHPILISNFSIHSGISFSSHHFSSYHYTNNADLDINIYVNTIKVPILLRYYYPIVKNQPFINLGISYLHNLKNETILYETLKSENIYEINNRNLSNLIENNQIGLNIGVGIEYKFYFKNSFFSEVRYESLFSNDTRTYIELSSIHFITGIIF